MLINIDHHPTNAGFGKINYVKRGWSSTAEIIFDLFEKWQVKIDKEMATRLFLGIYSDTGSFKFDYTRPETLRIGARLLELGASLRLIRTNLELNKSLKNLKYWSLVLGKMKINKKYRFVSSSISYQDFQKNKISEGDKAGATTFFAPIVKDTDFGVILREISPGEVNGGLRARTDFDVSKIALAMGGGGHKAAAGFRMKGSIKEVERKLRKVIDKIRNS